MNISLPALLSQLLLGLVNGSFYAILSLGLAVIFGLLNVINFAHGALFMMGAILSWMAMTYLNVNYWVMLIAAPLIVGVFGMLIEAAAAGAFTWLMGPLIDGTFVNRDVTLELLESAGRVALDNSALFHLNLQPLDQDTVGQERHGKR